MVVGVLVLGLNVAVEPPVKLLVEPGKHRRLIVGHVGELTPLQDVSGLPLSLNLPDEVLYQDPMGGMVKSQVFPAEFGRLVLTVLGPDSHFRPTKRLC